MRLLTTAILLLFFIERVGLVARARQDDDPVWLHVFNTGALAVLALAGICAGAEHIGAKMAGSGIKQRKPRSTLCWSGASEWRTKERVASAVDSKLEPRTTRAAPASGPVGFADGNAA